MVSDRVGPWSSSNRQSSVRIPDGMAWQIPSLHKLSNFIHLKLRITYFFRKLLIAVSGNWISPPMNWNGWWLCGQIAQRKVRQIICIIQWQLVRIGIKVLLTGSFHKVGSVHQQIKSFFTFSQIMQNHCNCCTPIPIRNFRRYDMKSMPQTSKEFGNCIWLPLNYFSPFIKMVH